VLASIELDVRRLGDRCPFVLFAGEKRRELFGAAGLDVSWVLGEDVFGEDMFGEDMGAP
jgi:hypothetical protein